MTIAPVPNHHADYPPFHGASGLIAALSMSVGRDGIAEVATDLIDLGPNDRLVDIGCGPGAGVRLASARAASVVGVDPAAVMLSVARLRVHRRNVRWVQAGAESLPLEDGSATVVWSLSAVHHWKDVAAGVAEVLRVLQPGGRFVAIEGLIDADATGLGSHGWTAAQAESFGDACRAAGFHGVEVSEQHAGERPVLAVVGRRRA